LILYQFYLQTVNIKLFLYERGIVTPLLRLNYSKNQEIRRSVAKIVQNISEHRFISGEKNSNQVKIFNDGIFDLALQWLQDENIWFKFVGCMTVSNLSMNKENARVIESEYKSYLKRLESFIECYDENPKPSLFMNWSVLQPHVPLLNSQFKEVQHFGLFCIYQFAVQRHFLERLWHAFSLNCGVSQLRRLATTEYLEIRILAQKIMNVLNIKETPTIVLDPSYTTLREFADAVDSQDFSDISFIIGQKKIRAHRVILASRCPMFKAMFTSGLQESREKEIPIENVSYETFKEMLVYLYTNEVKHINSFSAVPLLICADMYLLDELKQYIECYLEDFLDMDTCCSFLQIADQYSCNRLRAISYEFIQKNIAKIANTEGFAGMSPQLRILFADCEMHPDKSE